MREKIEILVKVQSIETEMDAVRNSLGQIPEKLEALEAKLSSSEEALAKQTTQLDELKKTYRSYESELQMSLTRAKRNQEKLSAVKNNKEYQALLRGIDDLKAKNNQIEDEMLACLGRTEEMEADITAQQDAFLLEKKQIAHEKALIRKEEKAEKAALSRLETDCQSVFERTDPDLLKTVTRIKKLVGGNAIASVTDGICSECNLNIPPQLYNDLQRLDSLNFCPHCQRIVYWDKALAEA